MNGYERVEQEITAEKGFEVGTIRIGAFPAVSARFLPRILRVIGDKYPGLKFVLHEGTIDEIRGWLASRFIDVGWIIPPGEELETVPFAKDNLILLLRDDHPLQRQAEIAIQDLDDEPLILCRGGFDVPIIELFDSFGVALNMRYAVHNVNTAISMVQEGLGMAIVSDTSMIQSVLPPGVRLRKFEPQPFRDIYLAVPSMKDASLAVKLFIQTALDLNRTEGSTDEGR